MKNFLRVTEVLSMFNDFSAIDPSVLANAADRGTRVHKYCENHALNLFVCDVDEDCKNYFEVFKTWFDTYVSKVLFTELRCYDEKLMITGCIDLIAILKGDSRPTLIDIKTPSAPSLSWRLQTAAYKLLLETDPKIFVERRLCLLLPKVGDKPKIIEYMNHIDDERLFINALELYKMFRKK